MFQSGILSFQSVTLTEFDSKNYPQNLGLIGEYKLWRNFFFSFETKKLRNVPDWNVSITDLNHSVPDWNINVPTLVLNSILQLYVVVLVLVAWHQSRVRDVWWRGDAPPLWWTPPALPPQTDGQRWRGKYASNGTSLSHVTQQLSLITVFTRPNIRSISRVMEE